MCVDTKWISPFLSTLASETEPLVELRAHQLARLTMHCSREHWTRILTSPIPLSIPTALTSSRVTDIHSHDWLLQESHGCELSLVPAWPMPYWWSIPPATNLYFLWGRETETEWGEQKDRREGGGREICYHMVLACVTTRAFVCTSRCQTDVIRWVSSVTGLVVLRQGLPLSRKLAVSARVAVSELSGVTCFHFSVQGYRQEQLSPAVLRTHGGPQVYWVSAPTQWALSMGSSVWFKPVFLCFKVPQTKTHQS